MVRPVTGNRTGAWKAGLAIAVVAGGLLWHILACTESPMAFSPSGKDLAFVTTDPYVTKESPASGATAYRLMILTDGRPLRTLEETRDSMLTAPAFSPDGKSLCYLRLPLFTEAQTKAIAEASKKRNERFEEAAKFVPPAAEPPAAEPPAEALLSPQQSMTLLVESGSAALPPLSSTVTFVAKAMTFPGLHAGLVVRDVKTGAVVSISPVDLPAWEFSSDGKGPPGPALMAYLTTRPQFSPDGKHVYFCAGNVVVAVTPPPRIDRPAGAEAAMAVPSPDGKNILYTVGDKIVATEPAQELGQRLLAAPATLAALSPDGTWIATLEEGAVGFLRTGGESALYRRFDAKGVSLSGMAWADKETLAILEGGEGRAALHLVRPDASPAKQLALDLPDLKTDKDVTGELAISPDGKRMVLGYLHNVYFLTSDGKVLRHWQGGDTEALAQPTFTPDSKRVAFKCFPKSGGKDAEAVGAIVFFAADGAEESRVAIPPAKRPEPEPAKEPAKEEKKP